MGKNEKKMYFSAFYRYTAIEVPDSGPEPDASGE